MTARPTKATCRSCGEPIFWAVTEAGTKMPLDLEPTEAGTVALSETVPPVARVASRRGRYPGQRLYVSHFGSCRYAAQHRKASQHKPPPAPALPQEGLFSDAAAR